MTQRQNWKKIISYVVISVLLFAAIFFLTFQGRGTAGERQSVKLVIFGDSVFGMIRTEEGIPDKISALTGMSVYNAALGGTCVARSNTAHRLAYQKDSLSLAGLADSLEADDFGVQQTTRIRESSTEYFEESIDGLAAIDFSEVETVLIQHGLNDFYSGIPIRNEANPYDEYTFAGALRTFLTVLQEKYPDIRIVLATPTYSWHIYSGKTCEEYNVGYGNMAAYIQEEIEIAEEFGVEMIDLFHDYFPHEQWADWEKYTLDGLHPNEEGRAMIAKTIAEYLESEK